MRTDNYQWTINYEGATPVTGTFLDGTPWIYPNGATLTFVGVSPQEVEITTAQGTGIVQRTVINPDFNKLSRNIGISGPTFDDSFTVLTCVGSTAPDLTVRIPFDFRGGVTVSGTLLGRYYDSTQGISQSNGVVSGIVLEVGDMIVTQTAHTGDFFGGDADRPWTESWGCCTIVGSQPAANSFRPPINWDPTDKANRPILTEVDTFSGYGLTYPNYSFSSDTKSWTETTICYDSSLDGRLGTIHPNFNGGTDNSSLRGTIKSQSMTDDEYGGNQAFIEEKMMISCFDPNVSGATQDLFRRTVAQRGIDIWGAMHSTGKYYSHNGYHCGEWNPKVYFAYAVTRDSRIFDAIDFTFGNTGNGTYKELAKELPFGLARLDGYHETQQASVGDPLCSYRHFDLPVLSSGVSGGVPYVTVGRPTRGDVQFGGGTGGMITYHLFANSTSNSGKKWGWSNNTKRPLPEMLIGSFIRTKGSTGGITRVIDGDGVSGDSLDPDSMVLYLQEDVVGPTADGITGCDLSNALVETRPDTIVKTITYEESNSSSPAGLYAYTYSVISHLLSNYLITKAIGLTADLPKWAQLQKIKSEKLVTTSAGKNSIANNINGSYNLGLRNVGDGTLSMDTLYFALCRQEIAAGISLDPAVAEYDTPNGARSPLWRDPANYYDMPATRTWEELQVIPNIETAIVTSPFVESNNSRDYYVVGSGITYGKPKWTQFNTDANGVTKLTITNNSPNGLTWGDFTDSVYCWIPGATFALGMTLESTTATGTGDISWIATWGFETEPSPFLGVIPASTNFAVIFAETP